MNKGLKAVIVVLVDIALLAVIVFAVRAILFLTLTELERRLCMATIIVAIPIIFYVTYLSFFGSKFDDLDIQDFEEELENRNNDENINTKDKEA